MNNESEINRDRAVRNVIRQGTYRFERYDSRGLWQVLGASGSRAC